MWTILFCIITAISLQFFDYLYHRKNLSNLFNNKMSFKEIKANTCGLSYRALDNYFAILPFLWSYLFIFASILLFNQFHSWLIRGLLILFVTGRYRTLQEIGHFAVHGALCPNTKWGLFLANCLYQFPLFMPEAKRRRDIHVRQHHHSVNMEYDPDLQELLARKFKIGMSPLQFWLGVFYPLTVSGIKDRLKECYSYLMADHYTRNFWLRIIIVLSIIFLFLVFQQMNTFIYLYLIPVLITYPLFYWIAHLALHRWFASCEPSIAYHERELELGRPTEFKGIIGFLIRHHIFPLGDSYHLAHSLFPMVRWDHLPQLDKFLKQQIPKYTENMSCNLIFTTSSMPSALSELKQRLIKGVQS